MTVNKIFFVSLGCDKNRIDSEKMLGYLSDAGFSFVSDENEADIIIVNTCAFIDPAKQESIDTILEMAEYKKSAKCKKLIVTGCLSERYADEIIKEMPEVDAILGVNDQQKIKDILLDNDLDETRLDEKNESKRILTTEGYYEYLKIADGCDKRCSYCIIPYIRGSYKSVSKEEILNEAIYLAECGIKELILVAQETTLYGKDIYGKVILPQLLKDLCRIDGIEWIRLLYAYPEDITDDLLNVMATETKICKYIDMPIQHASDDILKRMGRKTNRKELIDIINKARDIVPDMTLRTTLITGFPGESEKDHEILLDFVKEMRFDRLGVFKYSREEGTRAYDFTDQISEDVKDKRYDEIMTLQNSISKELLKKNINKYCDVIIHGKLADEDVYIGRTRMDAPDVDGNIFIRSQKEYLSGDIIKAKILKTGDYDMIGEVVD